MANRKTKKWEMSELINEILIHARVGLNVGPTQLREATQKIGRMSRSAITHRFIREGKKRLEK